MDIKSILSKVDHTLLSLAATWEEIKTVCDDAAVYGVASVCIPPSYVKRARDYALSDVLICTVIGFPLGYNTTEVKCFEAENAVKNGADEIDMVINIGLLKDKKYDEVRDEINAVKKACGTRLLKVIIETCLLTEEEKIKMCEIVSDSNADYIKTSTGFSTGGATKEDISLFRAHIKNGKKIKAAGGVSGVADAAEFIALGADRIGTSRVVKEVKGTKTSTGY